MERKPPEFEDSRGTGQTGPEGLPRFAVVAWALLVASAGCGGASLEPSCQDEACPTGQVCGLEGCEALTPPGETGDLGRYLSAGRLSDGRTVVATYDATNTNLVLVTIAPDGARSHRVIDGWRFEERAVVDTDAGRYASLAVGPQDVVHLAWFHADDGALRYAAVPASGPWTIEVVDGGDGQIRGRHASLALGEDGSLHLAYRDDTARRLRYATRSADGTWTLAAIGGCSGEPGCADSSAADYGEHASLVVVAGQPRVAFHDRALGDLKLAERDAAGGWTTRTLDGRDPQTGIDTGDVGTFARLVVDPQRRLAVAYHDVSRGALRFLTAGSPVPEPIVVDSGIWQDPSTGAMRDAVVGQHVDLAFDALGRATLVYLDATHLQVKSATLTGSTVLGPRVLPDLEPGGHFRLLSRADGGFDGAYGAWLAGEAPRTRLGVFELPDLSR